MSDDEYEKCAKCLDIFYAGEVEWEKVGGYQICDYCIDSFLDEIRELEKKDPGFLDIEMCYSCDNCGEFMPYDKDYCSDCAAEISERMS